MLGDYSGLSAAEGAIANSLHRTLESLNAARTAIKAALVQAGEAARRLDRLLGSPAAEFLSYQDGSSRTGIMSRCAKRIVGKNQIYNSTSSK